MPRFATVADVKVDLGDGRIPDSDGPRVLTLIDRAEARIRQVMGDPAELIASKRTDETLVRQVVSEMVAAVLRNPDAWQSSTASKTRGPYTESQSHTVNLEIASGQLQLTARQEELLGGRQEQTLPGPFSIPLTAW